jgi:glycosyltransferase involved in cell wall biosynthesis
MVRHKTTVYVLHTESIYARGGEKYIYELLKRLSVTYDVHLCIERISDDWRKLYEQSGIRVTKLWRPPAMYWSLLPLTLLVNYLLLRRFIRRGSTVISTNFPLNYLAVLLSDSTICHCFEPLAIFYDEARIASLPFKSRLFVKAAKFLYMPLDKYAIRKSRLFTTLNESVKRHILKTHNRTPDGFIPNGIDLMHFSPDAPPLLAGDRRFVIVHSTDYTVFKGTECMIDALNVAAKRYPDLRVVVSESMHDERMKRQYLAKIRRLGLTRNIEFCGTVPEADLPGFYTSADVFLYLGNPHCAGGTTASLSVLEAQACGVPIIRSYGNDDEIISGKTGVYVDPFRAGEVAEAIIRFRRMPKAKLSAMRTSARRHVAAQFSWEKSVGMLQSYIDTLHPDAP